jgi:hypothetical protein
MLYPVLNFSGYWKNLPFFFPTTSPEQDVASFDGERSMVREPRTKAGGLCLKNGFLI